MPSAVVRLLCEARNPSRSVRDAATLAAPFFWRGDSVRFELGLADAGAFLAAAAVGTLVVEVKALHAIASDDSFMRKVFGTADCDATFTGADWPGGAKQLLAAEFSVDESAIPAGTYRLIVRNEASDDSVLTYLSTELRVLEPQSGSAGIDPPPIAWDYLDSVPVVRTDVDQDLSDVAVAQALENLRLNHANGGLRILVNSTGGLELGLWNDTLATWRVLRLTGTGLDEQVTFDDLP
jgi:hypothetical protein